MQFKGMIVVILANMIGKQLTHLLKTAPMIGLWVLFGCQTPVPRPNNFTEKEIQLKDEQALPIAKVKVSVPIAFDTLLVWVDYSDCGGCETYKYRLTNAKGCLSQESGFFTSNYCLDSIYQFTVELSAANLPIPIDTATLEQIKHNDTNKHQDAWRRSYTRYQGRIETIHGKPFIMIRSTGRTFFSQDRDVEIFQAITCVAGRTVAFVCVCKDGNCPDFDAEAGYMLRSVVIDTLFEMDKNNIEKESFKKR